MTGTFTFDIFMTLDGYGSYGPGGDWGGYWGKQGPELLQHRYDVYGGEQRMVFGARTFRAFAEMRAANTEESGVGDDWVTRMRNLPTTLLSSTLKDPLDWPDATVASGDSVRDRQAAEGRVRRAAALARQPVVELGSAERRPGRPPAGDGLPRRQRHQREAADPRGGHGLRPAAAGDPHP